MTVQMILLSDLVPSLRNVRKVKTGIDQLAASIRADGLLQNLIVAAREDGKYEVIAGERRRRALRKLVKDKHWTKDACVPCEVREAVDSTALSYAENAQRVAMHPADAIRAFAELSEQGHDEPAIANRYGYDPREVRKLLALSRLSPKVVSALALDKIDVATAQAFTLTDDHTQQDKVLRSARSAYDVRRQLTGGKLAIDHRSFRFVGPEAYAAAGGTITRDLFETQGEGYADDKALVEQLAAERLADLGVQAESDGWPEVVVSVHTPHEVHSWHRLYPDQEGDAFSGDAMAGAVLVVTIGHDGEPQRQAYTKRQRRVCSPASSSAPAERPLYNARLIEDLSSIRTVALQTEVAKNAHLALAVLLDALLPIVEGSFEGQHAVQLRAGPGIVEPIAELEINTKPPSSPFDVAADLMGRVPDLLSERLAWLLDLDRDQHIRLLAACTGGLIDATMGKFADPRRVASSHQIARAANLDMREHWEGGIGFFDRLTKKALLAALKDACGPEAANNCARLGKHDLAAACAERIAGRGWLPSPLLTPLVDTDTALEEIDLEDEPDRDDVGLAA